MERNQPLTPPYAQPRHSTQSQPVAGHLATVTIHSHPLNNKKRPFSDRFK